MSTFSWLFGNEDFGNRDFSELEETVKVKLEEAADWRGQQRADLETRWARIQDIDDQLLRLTDQINNNDA